MLEQVLIYCQLRARRALSIFKDVPLRTSGALSLYKVIIIIIIITNSYIAHLITVRNINALYRQKWNSEQGN